VIHLPSFVGFARLFILLCWIALGAVFLIRKKPPGEAARRRAPVAVAGIVLQGAGFFAVWMLRAEMLPAFALPAVLLRMFCILAALLAVLSDALVIEAVRVLGKQWSFQARLIEGHRLVVAGPYSYMRHPIYTGMLGMLLATGLAFSVWWALLIALPVFAVGTAIRVRAEERLLLEAFGEDYEAYRRYVPAVIPRWTIRAS
jgi:protein-S-isoprenylcysteine O-methyltransferase Ste14